METTPLIKQFEIKVKTSLEKDFQKLISTIFTFCYGITDFFIIRDVQDDGCDGIIKSKKQIIACYGPSTYNYSSFVKKATDDFKKYTDHWQSKYPNWLMIVNHELSPDEISLVDSLGRNTSILGLGNIVHIIEHSLTSGQRRQLAKKLNIDNDFLAKDYIKELLDTLLTNDISITDSKIKYEHPTYINDKINLNYSKNDVADAVDDYILSSCDFQKIRQLFSTYEENDISSIKTKIRQDFSSIVGNFKSKVMTLSRQYHEKISSIDDDCLRFSKSLILYCFEQCIIGKKTKEEK